MDPLSRRAFLGAMAAGATIAAAEPAAAGRPAPRAVSTDVRPEALDDLTVLTALEAATLVRRRGVSPLELVDAHLDRIARFDGTYLAFNAVLAEEAREQARRLERRRPFGLLHGVPIAVKDNFFTAGVPTTANSHIFRDFVPEEDATCVSRLLKAGAIVLGKTQMGPLATTRATTPDGLVTTVNAWTPNTPAYDPGGSSSGSATATAGRMACSSIGTQTGGSITGPSNQQGLTGLKPTMGRTSLRGVIHCRTRATMRARSRATPGTPRSCWWSWPGRIRAIRARSACRRCPISSAPRSAVRACACGRAWASRPATRPATPRWRPPGGRCWIDSPISARGWSRSRCRPSGTS